MTHIGDDEGAVPELQLCTMRLADPHALAGQAHGDHCDVRPDVVAEQFECLRVALLDQPA